MIKYNQIHTLGTPHYKPHFQFLRKLQDFKCVLWSEKYSNCPTVHAKPVSKYYVIEQFMGTILK